jgi:aminoglycoside phosphotransferase
VAFYAHPASAADDTALTKELTAVIAAQHLSCGKIVNISTQAERDYLVTCQDGSNYQINPNSNGELAPHPLGQKRIH